MNQLPASLTFKEAFLFPIRTADGRRDILVGTIAILLLWPIGWVLNLGARLDIVERLYDGEPPYFRGMKPYRRTLGRGLVSASAIFCYLSPAIMCGSIVAWRVLHARVDPGPADGVLAVAGFIALVLGVYTLPGCMTVYACERDPSVLRKPFRAFQRVTAHRAIYAKAWAIAVAAVILSFFGLAIVGVGYIVASVWAWEVVGYAFTVAMYAPRETVRR